MVNQRLSNREKLATAYVACQVGLFGGYVCPKDREFCFCSIHLGYAIHKKINLEKIRVEKILLYILLSPEGNEVKFLSAGLSSIT